MPSAGPPPPIRLEVPYAPQKHQREWHDCSTRFLVAVCGRQIGKTTAAVNELFKRAVEKPGSRNWYVTNDYRQAKRNVWDELKRYIPKEIKPQYNNSELSVSLANGSKIELIGVENADSLRGAVVHFMILDEYGDFPSSVWPEVLRPTLSTTGGAVWFIGTPKGYNHFFDLYNLEHPDYTRFNVPSCEVENGTVLSTTNRYAKKEELQSALDTSSPEAFAQEYMGQFTRKRGAIWPRFRWGIHVSDRRPFDAALNHVCGIDFGYAIGHPTSFSVHEWNGQGDVFTGDGFLEENLNIEKIDELMRLKTKGLTVSMVYYDPARPDLAEDLKAKGWPMVPAIKDVELGIAKVDEFMAVNPISGAPRWTIARHLTAQIKQLEGYEWQEVRGEDGQYKDVPKKDKDDFCDELRYVLYTHTHAPEEIELPVYEAAFSRTGY